MSFPTLIQRANSGDETAIAAILQGRFSRTVRIQVRFSSAYLQVTLTSPSSLDRSKTLSSVHQALAPVGHLFRQVQVQNSVRGQANPAWCKTISWQQLSLENASLAGRYPGNRSPLSIPDWIAAKPSVETYWKLLQQNFEVGKLIPIGFLGLYALCFAKYYNISDFVEGGPFLMRFLHGVNLIFHEAGHIIFMILGQFMGILGGSLTQILIPAGISSYFFVHRQNYSGALTLCWVGENFWDVSIYIKDAQAMGLPLLGGEGVIHDWNWLLETLHLLRYDQPIGNLTYWLGSGIYISAIVLAILHSRQSTHPKRS